jgi:hypothetical protein
MSKNLEIVNAKVLSDVEEHFRSIYHKDLTNFFDRFVVLLVDELMIVLASDILLLEIHYRLKFIVMRFEAPPNP